MYRFNKTLLPLAIVCACTATRTYSQNNTSPYSILGIGDIETSQFDRTAGMGGTGIAYRPSLHLSLNNPASYSALAKGLLYIEATGRGRFVSYSGRNIGLDNDRSRDFAVRRFSIGIKLNDRWGSSFGIAPVSTSNYLFSGTKNVQGTNTNVPASYEGTGGVNQFYWAHGVSPLKNLSLGVQAAFLWGNLSQTETFLDANTTTALSTTRDFYVRNLRFTFGGQYVVKLNNRWELSLGGKYSPRTQLRATYDVSVREGADTILKTEVVRNDYFSLPQSVGAGFALANRNGISILGDYTYSAWSSTRYNGRNYSLEDARGYSLGFEYSHRKRYGNLFFEEYYLQAGVFFRESYLRLYGEQLNDMGLSAGVGKNFRRNTLGISAALEFGRRGKSTTNLIREDYTNIYITFAYKDFLGGKRRYD